MIYDNFKIKLDDPKKEYPNVCTTNIKKIKFIIRNKQKYLITFFPIIILNSTVHATFKFAQHLSKY